MALTQLVVEIVTTVLILLGLRWLPKRQEDLRSSWAAVQKRSTKLPSAADLLLALITGGGMALLSFAMLLLRLPKAPRPSCRTP